MVKGLDVFREYFREFYNHYIIIGGTACEQRIEEQGLFYRATKDIDLLVVIENLGGRFLMQFKKFIDDGGYLIREHENVNRRLFRFSNPQNPEFPHQLEVLSIRPENIKEIHGMKYTSLQTNANYSGISAILTDPDYYQFTLQHSDRIDDLHLARVEALICLKVYAFNNLTKMKSEGQIIRSDEIKKHRNDVFRLTTVLQGTVKILLPVKLKNDMQKFIAGMMQEQPDIDHIFKDMRINPIALDELLAQLVDTFDL